MTPRLGPPPWLTIAIGVATAAVTAVAFIWPDVMAALRRDPAIITEHQYWRLFTSFFIYGDSAVQIGLNVLALAIFGTLVEWRIGPGYWLAGYVAAALVGELAGLVWEPLGPGNSVAIAGLAGLLAVHQLLRADRPLQARLGLPMIVVIGGIGLSALSDMHGPPLLTGLVVGVIGAAASPERFHPGTEQ